MVCFGKKRRNKVINWHCLVPDTKTQYTVLTPNAKDGNVYKTNKLKPNQEKKEFFKKCKTQNDLINKKICLFSLNEIMRNDSVFIRFGL